MEIFGKAIDLRTAAMHNDGVDANLLQQHDIVRKVRCQILFRFLQRISPQLDDKLAARIKLHVRQRCRQDARLLQPSAMSFVRRAHLRALCVVVLRVLSGGGGLAAVDMACDHPLLSDREHIVPSPVDDEPCRKASEQEGEKDGQEGEDLLLDGIDGKRIEELKAKGIIHGGMLPKIDTGLEASRRGVSVVILDGRVPHTLLLELFTETGVGSLIRAVKTGA